MCDSAPPPRAIETLYFAHLTEVRGAAPSWTSRSSEASTPCARVRGSSKRSRPPLLRGVFKRPGGDARRRRTTPLDADKDILRAEDTFRSERTRSEDGTGRRRSRARSSSPIIWIAAGEAAVGIGERTAAQTAASPREIRQTSWVRGRHPGCEKLLRVTPPLCRPYGAGGLDPRFARKRSSGSFRKIDRSARRHFQRAAAALETEFASADRTRGGAELIDCPARDSPNPPAVDARKPEHHRRISCRPYSKNRADSAPSARSTARRSREESNPSTSMRSDMAPGGRPGRSARRAGCDRLVRTLPCRRVRHGRLPRFSGQEDIRGGAGRFKVQPTISSLGRLARWRQAAASPAA